MNDKIDRYSVAVAQGGYYLVTGLWPFLHLSSFLAVTGPRKEIWLVKTVGALVGFLGGGLLWTASHRALDKGLVRVAAGSALSLPAIDIYYALKQKIAPVYLLDAAVEMGLATLWMRRPTQEKWR